MGRQQTQLFLKRCSSDLYLSCPRQMLDRHDLCDNTENLPMWVPSLNKMSLASKRELIEQICHHQTFSHWHWSSQKLGSKLGPLSKIVKTLGEKLTRIGSVSEAC